MVLHLVESRVRLIRLKSTVLLGKKCLIYKASAAVEFKAGLTLRKFGHPSAFDNPSDCRRNWGVPKGGSQIPLLSTIDAVGRREDGE